MRMHLALIAAIALAAGCSTASGGGSNDAAANAADADPNAPDADPNAPDANASTPDAPVGTPDAAISIDATPPIDAVPPPDADPAAPDATPTPDAAVGACDPIAQTGCPGTEKCTWNITNMVTECAANGNILNGNTCTFSAGIDNCVKSNFCVNGNCEIICSTNPNSCATGSTCTLFTDTFSDNADTGVCQPGCDPLAPTCSVGDGCYLFISSGAAVCAPPSATGTQGDACDSVNDCNPGNSCLLNNAPTGATGLDCAFYCDSTAGGGPSCTDVGGPGAGFQCCEIRTFYNNSGNVPAGIGMCTNIAEWGACPT